MRLDSRIYVAGHRGLAGSAIVRKLHEKGYHNLLVRSHADLDLTDQKAVRAFFEREKPDYVFLAAARVGGILANNTYRAEFIYQNLMIEANVIHSAYLNKVKKLLFMGSSCIYPKYAPQPMKEEHLLTGLLEPTNEPYAIAKIAGIKMCDSYNRQYNTNFISLMPTNLYGPNDNYDLQDSHIIPALIRKMHEAKVSNDKNVVIWGTGSPRREFLYSDDLADASVSLMERRDAKDIGEFVNVGVGKDISTKELAELIASTIGYTGKLVYDTSKPDGAPQKLLDVTHLRTLGWTAGTSLKEGLKKAYQAYLTSD